MSTPPKRQQVADDIELLKGLEVIRRRPGMYLGSFQHVINRMTDALLDTAINEAMAGICDHVDITLHADRSITVSDNSSGMPVGIDPRWGVSFLEVELTMLLVGSYTPKYLFEVIGGMHGVRLKAVQAVSEWLIAEVRRDGHLWRQSYARGVPTSDLVQVRPLDDTESTGNSITFLADVEIFGDIYSKVVFDYDVLADRCRHVGYLLHGSTIRLIDRRVASLPRETTFRFDGGLETFVKDLNGGRTPLHAPISGMKTIQIDNARTGNNTIEIEFAFQYTDDSHTTELAFVNTVETPDGGAHLTGLRTALTRTINAWAQKTGYIKSGEFNFTGRDTRKGLTAVVSLKHSDPLFENAAKLRLDNPEIIPIVASVILGTFAEHLKTNPEDAQRIFNNCRSAAENG